jgi:hypothetical protein
MGYSGREKSRSTGAAWDELASVADWAGGARRENQRAARDGHPCFARSHFSVGLFIDDT